MSDGIPPKRDLTSRSLNGDRYLLELRSGGKAAIGGPADQRESDGRDGSLLLTVGPPGVEAAAT